MALCRATSSCAWLTCRPGKTSFTEASRGEGEFAIHVFFEAYGRDNPPLWPHPLVLMRAAFRSHEACRERIMGGAGVF